MGPAIGKGNGSVEPVSQEIWEGLVGGESGPPLKCGVDPLPKKNPTKPKLADFQPGPSLGPGLLVLGPTLGGLAIFLSEIF